MRINFGNRHEDTAVIYNTLDPVWNEKFNFTVDQLAQPIEFTMFDHDMIGNDRVIGVVNVPSVAELLRNSGEDCDNDVGTPPLLSQLPLHVFTVDDEHHRLGAARFGDRIECNWEKFGGDIVPFGAEMRRHHASLDGQAEMHRRP